MILDKYIEDFLVNSTIIDTETTHHLPQEAEIVEVGASTYDTNTKTFKVNDLLIKPFNEIPFAASSKNNISREMLKNKPYFEECYETALDLLNFKNTKYAIAHNVAYDQTVIEKECINLPKDKLLNKEGNPIKWICTYKLSKILFQHYKQQDENYSFSLNYQRFFFDIDRMDSSLRDKQKICLTHRAGDDSFTCAKFLIQIIQFVTENGLFDPNKEDIGEFLYEIQNTIIKPETVPFGKHKGKTFQSVPTDYYVWCIENMNTLDETDFNFDAGLSLAIAEELERRGAF